MVLQLTRLDRAIERLTVSLSRQRQGIGSALVIAGLSLARSTKYDHARRIDESRENVPQDRLRKAGRS